MDTLLRRVPVEEQLEQAQRCRRVVTNWRGRFFTPLFGCSPYLYFSDIQCTINKLPPPPIKRALLSLFPPIESSFCSLLFNSLNLLEDLRPSSFPLLPSPSPTGLLNPNWSTSSSLWRPPQINPQHSPWLEDRFQRICFTRIPITTIIRTTTHPP